MSPETQRVWSREEQALAIWRFRQVGKTYGALPATLRELAHLFGTREEAVRRLFHRINYLERLAPAVDGYVNGPRKYDLRATWEHFRDNPAELETTASATQQRLRSERGDPPARKPVEFGKYKPKR